MKVPEDLVLQATSDNLEAIYEAIGKTKEELEEMVAELQQWKKTQLHLPEDEEISHLGHMITLNKLNMNKTKCKLDNYYSYRNFYPEFYEEREPLSPKIQNVLDSVMLLPLPKLLNNTTRICISKLINDDPSIFDFEATFKVIFCVGDLRIHYDKGFIDVFIADFACVQVKHILKVKFILLKKGFDVLKNVFSDRIKEIHILNCPSYAYVLLTFVKSFLPVKISERIIIHNDVNSLLEYIDAENLPQEYGGTLESLSILYDRWRQFFEQHSDWLTQESAKRSNEKLRPKKDGYLKRLYNNYFT